MDPRLDREDLEDVAETTYFLEEGPEHVSAPDASVLPGFYRATFSTARGERLERFLSDAGYGAVLRRRNEGTPTFTAAEFEDWTVAPDLGSIEARVNAEAGQGG
ncbi:MAG TPA: hypothetical protein VLA82_01415 [Actinomycetota bacterium]|nr:hypothetical protein [Actinomycetota bacterium]